MIKLIHPETGIVREVAESNQNKIRILRRGGMVDYDTYKPKQPRIVDPGPTVSDVVEEHQLIADPTAETPEAEIAIHVSSAARKLIEKEGLDPALIEGTGKNGQITKPDVKEHLKALKESEKELPEAPPEPEVEDAPEEEVLSAEDILTHDDPAPEEAGPIEQTGPEPEVEEVDPVEEELVADLAGLHDEEEEEAD